MIPSTGFLFCSPAAVVAQTAILSPRERSQKADPAGEKHNTPLLRSQGMNCALQQTPQMLSAYNRRKRERSSEKVQEKRTVGVLSLCVFAFLF